MPFAPRFSYNDEIVRSLGQVEGARAVIEVLPLPLDRVLFLRQAARHRATRNSTKIEGNTLNSVEVGKAVVSVAKSQTEMQQEVRNYWRALEWIEESIDKSRPIDEGFIRELHCIILVRGHGRRGHESKYRVEECPVVDSATRRIDYAPPSPDDVPMLMREMVHWLSSNAASRLPVPVRAGLLAYRFVTIHPFSDGNGRTARALATTELWRSGYYMQGFLSLEEYYTADIAAYYDNLQMGLPVNYYEGRHDPDHTRWIDYFTRTMAKAATELRHQAIERSRPDLPPSPPWSELGRVQQQLLTRLLTRSFGGVKDLKFVPGEIVEWFGVSSTTAKEWLKRWRAEGFVEPAKAGTQRTREFRLTTKWEKTLVTALNREGVKASGIDDVNDI